MNRTMTLTSQESLHKAHAESYLAEARRILRQLASERRREERRRTSRPDILAEVKAILEGR